MKRMFLALLCVLALSGWGKAESGRDFNGAAVTQLQVGHSTLADAVTLLGRQPDTSQVGQSGAIAHAWIHVTGKSSFWTGNVQASIKSVTLVFASDGTFQRILKLQGIELATQDRNRLMTPPPA